MKKQILSLLFSIAILVTYHSSRAHCDTKDGPVVAAAIKAINQNNINYVLIWIKPEYEQEIKEAFQNTMKVRILSPDAEKLADNYFFETLVRLHRSGEGIPYTGIKPAGTPVDKKILAADNSITQGNLSSLLNMVPKARWPELNRRFKKVMQLKNYPVDDVAAGREYIEAYVQFFHFAEGEEEHKTGNHPKEKH